MSSEGRIPRGRLRRLGKIVGMTTRVGADLVAGKARKLLGDEGEVRHEAARRILDTLGELKGAAMKVGQTLALLSDQLPPEAQKIVARLFSQAPTLPYEAIARVIETELGKRPLDLFAEIDETPLAAASLGQVHRARLKTGEEVVVKVQYPDVANALAEDLKNVRAIVQAVGMGSKLLDGRDYFEEMRREVTAELDYRRELALVEEFRSYLARWPDLVVPRTFPQLSTGKVLVLEWLVGPTLHAFVHDMDGVPNDERFAISERLARAVLGPFLYHRVIHGDAHPGNFVVMEGGRLGVLDYGSVKHLSERFWRCYIEGFSSAFEGRKIDYPTILRSGGFTIDLSDERAGELLETIARTVGAPLKGPHDFGRDTMVPRLLQLKRTYSFDLLKIRLPPEALLFYRAVAGLGHNLRSLKASGDFRPFLREALDAVGPSIRVKLSG